jgi:sulfate permease, SulP family
MKLSFAQAKNNVLSGITVAFALVPEAIAFAIVAHVNPLTGMYAAFIMCLITAVFGGRPGMISGATGAIAVVIAALVVQHGVQYLFAAVLLMGSLQLLFGALRLGKFIRMVPHPVMLGFVNGLAIVIALAQLPHFQQHGAWIIGRPLWVMLGLVALAMAIIYLLPRLTRAIPSALVAILAIALLTNLAGIETRTVGDLASIKGGLPSFHIPDVPWNLATLRIVFPYALIMALVGLIESLLTLNLIDDMTDTRGKPNRECLAQGGANIVTGLFGGMGGCAMIGQSMINVGAGATHRLSGIVAGLGLLSFILFGSGLIERIPLAALIGVMFVVSIKTFEWGSVRVLGKVPPADALVIVAVTVVTIFTDLALAVVIGVVIAALVFAWQHAKEIRATTRVQGDSTKVYELEGTLFFASAKGFHNLFTPVQDPSRVIVEFGRAKVMDHSAIEAIDALAERYQKLGKRLHLRHLSPDCAELLLKASGMVESDATEDPHYHLADDRLG